MERLFTENGYKRIHIITVDHIIEYRVSKKQKLLMTKTDNTAANAESTALKHSMDHDKEKIYLLKEGMPVLPLIDLGVFTKDFHIIKAKYYKFKQINSFLRNIVSGIDQNIKGALRIIEFGCGKSYLTFILYYYFAYIKKINVEITGYDKDCGVVDLCNNVARKYQYENLKFIEGDVSQIAGLSGQSHGNADMLITLHACDTATDHALYYAVKNKVRYIFCVPCCQQEINAQIKRAGESSRAAFNALLRYGLYKERFSALLTDCIRCETLNDNGYYVDVVEFIGEENTPKNAMIRARYTGHTKNYGAAVKELTSLFGIEQTLLKLMEEADLIKNRRENVE